MIEDVKDKDGEQSCCCLCYYLGDNLFPIIPHKDNMTNGLVVPTFAAAAAAAAVVVVMEDW